MDNEARQLHGQTSIAARGAAVLATLGLAVGLVELLLGTLSGEAVLVESPWRHPLPYMLVGALLGAIMGPVSAVVDVGLRRLGRARPRPGILVPLCLGLGSAVYAFQIVHWAGAPWSAVGTRTFWAVLIMVALCLAAMWPTALRAPASGWPGYLRAAEIAATAAVSLVLVTLLAHRSGWVKEVTATHAGAVARALLLHPLGLGTGLALEGLLVARLGRIGRVGRVLRPAPLVLAGLALLAALKDEGGGSSAGDRARAPSIVLVVLDGARWDSVSVGAAMRNPTPGFDGVAKAGALFSQARTPSPWCLPGHLAMFTGAPASASGVTEENLGEFRPARRRGSPTRTLAEQLSSRGYATVAFSNNPWVASAMGLDAGFQQFFELATLRHQYLGASRLVRKMLANPVDSDDGAADTMGAAARWVERHRDRPFFLFVNLSEPMPPWTPPNPYRDRALDGAKVKDRNALRTAVKDPLAYSLGAVALDWGDADLMREVYQAEVAAADAAILQLLAAVQRAGLVDRTIVAVTADHGYAFDSGTHYAGNKMTLSEGVLRVPLAIRGPGIEAGRRVDAPVSTIDLAPTLLEMAGAPAAPAAQGRSLVALLRGDEAAVAALHTRPQFAELRSPRFHLDAIKHVAPNLDISSLDRDQFAVILGGRKLRFDSKGKRAVHDLEGDPDEGNAAWGESEEGKIAARELQDVFDRWRATQPAPRSSGGPASGATEQVLTTVPLPWWL